MLPAPDKSLERTREGESAEFLHQRTRRSAQSSVAMRLRALLGILAILASGPACAEETHLGPVLIKIPPEFSGPRRSIPYEGVTQEVYEAYAIPGQQPNLLLLSHLSLSPARRDIGEEDLYAEASNFLTGGLKILKRERTGWSQSGIEKVRLGGRVGARAYWSGNLYGVQTNGVSYVVIIGDHGYRFNAFGNGTEPNAALKSSIRAIEGLRVEATDKSLERTRAR